MSATRNEGNGRAAVVIRGFSQYFGGKPVVRGLDLEIRANEILGVIGPAGSGKSTFLCALNRLNDLVRGARSACSQRANEQYSIAERPGSLTVMKTCHRPPWKTTVGSFWARLGS